MSVLEKFDRVEKKFKEFFKTIPELLIVRMILSCFLLIYEPLNYFSLKFALFLNESLLTFREFRFS
jgi:hypothetical protein